VEPTKIVSSDQIILLGLGFFGDPFATSGGWTEENEIGRLWSRFLKYCEHHADRLAHVVEPGVSYELHIPHEETASTGHYEVFVGIQAAWLENVPVELSVKILPPTSYAVFTLTGQQITSEDWLYEIQAWLTASDHRQAYAYSFQRYDSRFKGLDKIDESVLDVYVPVA
jgi:predicted transcriptional regulator YdeE